MTTIGAYAKEIDVFLMLHEPHLFHQFFALRVLPFHRSLWDQTIILDTLAHVLHEQRSKSLSSILLCDIEMCKMSYWILHTPGHRCVWICFCEDPYAVKSLYQGLEVVSPRF